MRPVGHGTPPQCNHNARNVNTRSIYPNVGSTHSTVCQQQQQQQTLCHCDQSICRPAAHHELCKHADALCDVDECKALGRRHNDRGIKCHSLAQCQLDVPRARWEVHHKVVKLTCGHV
eukprot:353182-Chlamydomonas_euryale.AAC.27